MILTVNMLKSNYSSYSNPLDKIKRDVREEKLYRLTRGVYINEKDVDPIFLAASILSPSYISFEYALSFYGLIPERVVAITSASFRVRKNKRYINHFGRFEFSDIPSNVFPYEINVIRRDGYACRIASKEKALCDCLYKWRVVRSVKDLKILLFEDKRIDEDEFMSMNFAILIELAALYKKTNLEFLIKLVKKEYLHE